MVMNVKGWLLRGALNQHTSLHTWKDRRDEGRQFQSPNEKGGNLLNGQANQIRYSLSSGQSIILIIPQMLTIEQVLKRTLSLRGGGLMERSSWSSNTPLSLGSVSPSLPKLHLLIILCSPFSLKEGGCYMSPRNPSIYFPTIYYAQQDVWRKNNSSLRLLCLLNLWKS